MHHLSGFEAYPCKASTFTKLDFPLTMKGTSLGVSQEGCQSFLKGDWESLPSKNFTLQYIFTPYLKMVYLKMIT